VPGFVNYKKGCTRFAAASDKVYQLLAHGRWFSPGTPASSTTKTGCHDITEILLKVALKHQKSINQSSTNKTDCHDITEILLKVALKHQKSINQSSTNKTDCHDITEILLKVAVNTIKQTNNFSKIKIINLHVFFLILFDNPRIEEG
jgi:hypothetical protein